MPDLYTLSFTEKRDWLRLIRTPTIGPVSFRDLIIRYGSASAALEALPDLSRRKPVNIPDIETIEAEIEACETRGVKLVAACEPDYPDYLRAIDPPPPVLSVWGDIDILRNPCVAMVGSRNASALEQKFAYDIAHELGKAGYTIVSGLARGIDASAHRGSLGTGTAAVLGGGIDHVYVYPRQNAELFDQIRETGAIISESPLGYRATARDFPRRNRIISGLSRGVVVVEAAERSGTLITARYALEQNREVMAAPGSPLDPRTKGCNRLIRQGAALVESADDILAVLNDLSNLSAREPAREPVNPQAFDQLSDNDIDHARAEILSLVSPTPTARDTLIRASGVSPHLAIAALLELEICGDVHVEPDGRIALKIQ